MVKLAPSILNADFSRLAAQIRALEEGGADWLHLDIMDGHFVPNFTFGPMIVAAIKKLTRLPLDVHLMISDADMFLSAFRQAGADVLTVHYEACLHLWRTLENIRNLGATVGVTLNPATPIDVLKPVLPIVDMVLVMSVEPGFGGQKFIPHTLEKIEQLVNWRKQLALRFEIEVDGGIDADNAAQVATCGADILVVGNAIFSQSDVATAVRSLRQKITEIIPSESVSHDIN